MQKQTKLAEKGITALQCTYKNCKKLQAEDGEFCEKHLPFKKCLHNPIDDNNKKNYKHNIYRNNILICKKNFN